MKKIIFVLIFLLVLAPNVYAQDFTVSNSDISSPNSSGTGKYTGTEIYNSGTSNVYNIGTRYNGRLSRIVFNLASGGYADSNGFEKSHTYTITMNMATDDWRNNFGSVSVKCEGSSGSELSNGRVTYISYKKIKFSFTAPSNSWCQFVYIDLKSSNVNSVPFTGVTNWNLSSLVISDPLYSSGGSGGGSSATPTPSNDYSSIINNQNQNTQDIINSQNSNTQDIIENNNQNTQDIIDNQNKNTESTNELLGNCYKNYLLVSDYHLTGYASINTIDASTGTISFTSSNYDALYYDLNDLKPNTNYTISYTASSDYIDKPYLELRYTLDFGQTFYTVYGTGSINHTFNTGSHSTLRITFLNSFNSTANSSTISNLRLTDTSSTVPYSLYNEQVCSSKLDSTNQAINDLNDTINNDDIDDKTGFFTGFTNNMHGLSSIITIPLSTIQSLSNTSCVSLTLPIPFTNDTLTLPCMSQVYDTYAHDIYYLWQLVSFGIISYYICIDIFKIVKGFKNPDEDKIEVLDL